MTVTGSRKEQKAAVQPDLATEGTKCVPRASSSTVASHKDSAEHRQTLTPCLAIMSGFHPKVEMGHWALQKKRLLILKVIMPH